MSALSSPIESPKLRPELDPFHAGHPASAKRSTLVTVLGWLGVLKFGPSLAMAFIQLTYVGDIFAAFDEGGSGMSIAYAMFAFVIALSAFGLLTSVRLLQRVEWARKVTVLGLLLGALSLTVGAFAPAMTLLAGGFAMPGVFVVMFPVVFLPFAFAGLLVARYLGRHEIRAEFN